MSAIFNQVEPIPGTSPARQDRLTSSRVVSTAAVVVTAASGFAYGTTGVVLVAAGFVGAAGGLLLMRRLP